MGNENKYDELKLKCDLGSWYRFSDTREELENRIQYLEGKIEGLDSVIKVLQDLLDKR
jgi:hypothetical protein